MMRCLLEVVFDGKPEALGNIDGGRCKRNAPPRTTSPTATKAG